MIHADHAGAPAVAGHTVLVVDDDADLRDSVVRFLETTGVQAVGAPGGRQALDLLRGGLDVCLILLDMRMPGMDGWAFREAQMRDPRIADVPVVTFSAEPLSDARAEALHLDAHLLKPADPAVVAEVVAQRCAHR